MGCRAAMGLFVVLAAVHANAQNLAAYEASETAYEQGLAAQERALWSAATEAYERAIARDPGFVEAMANIARVRHAVGDLEGATRWVERGLAVRSDYPDLFKVRALVAHTRGRFHEAIAALRRARSLAPGDVEVEANLGAALLGLGVSGEARRVLDHALVLDATCRPCWLNLAIALEQQGLAQRARFTYRRYLAMSAADTPRRAEVQRRILALDETMEKPALRP